MQKKHFKGFSMITGGVQVKVSLQRFEKQFMQAQYQLDSDVMESMVPFMPMQDGLFIADTRGKSASVAGTGKVYAAFGLQGRFLYAGKTMVDEKTGSPWARKDAKKVLVSHYAGKTRAREHLQYSKAAHPEAQKEWFLPAKERDGKRWVKDVKKIAGGGKHGG